MAVAVVRSYFCAQMLLLAQGEALQREQRSVVRLALRAVGERWLLRCPGPRKPCCGGYHAIGRCKPAQVDRRSASSAAW